MSELCRVVIVGRLGADPESRAYKNGNGELLTFSITPVGKPKNKKTQWHRVVVFGKQVESCKKYLSKGDLCCVEGYISQSEYEKNGVMIYSSEIVGDRISFLGKSSRSAKSVQEENIEETVPF